MNTKFESADSSPGFIFWKVANLHQRKQRQVLKDLDISPTQYSLLACYFFLSTPEDLPSQADICEMAGLDKMLVSDTTKALLKKKLIVKRENEFDQRSFLVELTDEGRKVCNKAVKLIEELDNEFFGLSGNTKLLHSMMQKIEKKAQDL